MESLDSRVMYSVTAVLSSATGTLTITGDDQSNAIVVSRNAAGTILVNGGALAVTGGTPSVANTRLIQINGLGGNDTLSVDETNGAMPSVNIDGGAGNDTMSGGSSNDSLTGGAGNDTFRFDTDKSLGSDTINESGGGVDTLDFSATTTRGVNINLANAAAQIVNAGLTLTLSAGNTIENVTGGALGDTITGNALNNVIEGGGSNDSLVGGAGNDTFRFDTDNALGSDTINDSGGTDTFDFSGTTTRAVNINLGSTAAQVVNPGLTLTLGAGNTIENVKGGALGDTIVGNTLSNVIEGGAGDDTMTGGAGNDTYRFDADNALGADTINETGGGVDTLDFSATTTRSVNVNLSNGTQVVNAGLVLNFSTGSSIENVIGGSLGDVLTGNSLNNALTGGGGDDTLTGGAGNDTYRFDTDVALGTDTVVEIDGGGIDTLDFSATTTRAVQVQLTIHNFAQTVNDGLKLNLLGTDAIENVVGGALGDTINGNGLNNVLTGGAGDDTLTGGNGDDTLSGGAGDDQLFGGIGTDVVDGGTGNNIVIE